MSSGVINTSLQKSERRSNLELFRIIVMLLIVAHHYVVNSGLSVCIDDNPHTLRTLFYLLFGAWGKIGINCFVCITSWFMCKSEITLEKFVKLLTQVYFYKIIIFAIFYLSGYEHVSLQAVFRILSPFGSGIQDNFTGCFLLFYLLIPFLNVMLKNLTQRQHLYLVTLLIGVYCIAGSLPSGLFYVSINYVGWFSMLYIMVAYLRFYPSRLDDIRYAGWLFVLCMLISVLSVVCVWQINKMFGTKIWPYIFVADSNKFLAVATGITSFLFFKNLPIGQSKFINTISATTFGVLCIHANSNAMREFLWNRFFRNADFYSSPFFILHAFGTVLAVFTICSLIDFLRRRFLDVALKLMP